MATPRPLPGSLPSAFPRLIEVLLVVSVLVCAWTPSAASAVVAALATAGLVVMLLLPQPRLSREDRLIAFACVAGGLCLAAAATALPVEPLHLLHYAPLLLVPGVLTLTRRTGTGAIAWLVLIPTLVLIKSYGPLASAVGWVHLSPHAAAWLLIAAVLLLVLIPLRQFAWGVLHPSWLLRAMAAASIAVLLLWVPGLALTSLVEPTEDPAWIALLIALSWSALRAYESALLRVERVRIETVSVAIICKDEADRIGALLEAVRGWADEIVVLDSGSSDGTVDIARRYTDRVEVTDWPGYGAQKQRAIERCTSDWVLSLDADEVPSAALMHEIDLELDGSRRADAYRFPWVSMVFGGPVHFGADGRLHLRLFRRDGAAHFDDRAVHEGVVDAGIPRTLHGWVEHHTFRDRAHADAKFASYARIQAEERFAKGRRATRLGATLRGIASFILLYGMRLGVLDGRRGLLMAFLYARYTRDKYAALAALTD